MDRALIERLGLAAAALLFLLACNAVYFGHYVDDIVWVLLSQSMLKGSLAASWSAVPSLETHATWGFSLLLAPVTAVFGSSALALKAASAAMLAGGLALFYLATRKAFEAPARALYLSALFFNGFVLSFSGAVISEAGYALLVGLAVYLVLRRGWLERRIVALGLLSAAIILTRVIGAALAAAVFGELVLARRPRDALRFAAACAAALPYFIVCKLASGAYTYHGQGWALWEGGASRAAALLSRNAWFYLKGLTLLTYLYCPAFLPNVAWLKIAAAAALGGVAVWGAARAGSKPPYRFLLLYALAYACVCLAWPFQAPRFVLPAYPLFLFFSIAGLAALGARRKSGPAFAALIAAAVLSNGGEVFGLLRRSFVQAPDMPHASHLWLRDHSLPDDLIVSMDIARVRYYAGRRGWAFIPEDSAESFAKKARELRVRYFFLKEAGYVASTLEGQDPVAAQHQRLERYLSRGDLFALAYENKDEGVRVYARR